jgi:signal transduction histidine kinase
LSYSGADKDLYAFADREQLILVFNNLIKNAFQAIPTNKNGYIDINVKSDNDKIYVFIKDNGTGMNEETKEKLFSPNFTTKSTGMGLGLAISKNIIQMLGGDITFESEWNVGTVFKIEIPKLKESS